MAGCGGALKRAGEGEAASDSLCSEVWDTVEGDKRDRKPDVESFSGGLALFRPAYSALCNHRLFTYPALVVEGWRGGQKAKLTGETQPEAQHGPTFKEHRLQARKVESSAAKEAA